MNLLSSMATPKVKLELVRFNETGREKGTGLLFFTINMGDYGVEGTNGQVREMLDHYTPAYGKRQYEIVKTSLPEPGDTDDLPCSLVTLYLRPILTKAEARIQQYENRADAAVSTTT